MPNKTTRNTETDNSKPYTFSDEATKKKIRRHINDINDVITEKDIKNAKVPGAEDEPVRKRAPRKRKEEPTKNPEEQNKPNVDDTPGNPATPWDILQE